MSEEESEVLSHRSETSARLGSSSSSSSGREIIRCSRLVSNSIKKLTKNDNLLLPVQKYATKMFRSTGDIDAISLPVPCLQCCQVELPTPFQFHPTL